MTLSQVIAAHEAVLSRPRIGLGGIPFPRYTVEPAEPGGFLVIDGVDGSWKAWDAGEGEAEVIAARLNGKAWRERRAAIEAAAEAQGEDAQCDSGFARRPTEPKPAPKRTGIFKGDDPDAFFQEFYGNDD